MVDGNVPRGTTEDPRRRASRVIANGHGRGRVRSPSPVRAASMGLPPMPPPQDEIQSNVVFGRVIAFVVGCHVSVNVAFEIAYTMHQ